MRYRFFSTIFLAITLIPVAALSQTATRKYMAGLSANFFDYQGPLTNNYGQVSTYDPGIAFAGYGYISNAFNYSLNTTFAPEVVYPTSENTFITTSMLDVRGMLRWTILDPNKFFVPYIGTGFGLNSASNNLRMYVPASVGFRLKFTETFGLQWESTWQQSIKAGDFQPVSHMVGFVFAMSPRETPPPSKNDEEVDDRQIAVLPDSDGDGVPDRDDQCPDEKGLHMYLGCPEPEDDEPASTSTSPPQQQMATQVPNKPAQQTIQQAPVPAQVTPVIPVESMPQEPRPEERRPVPSSDSDLASLNMQLQNIYFDHASFELTKEAYSILDEIAEILRQHPDLRLQVMGHTDNSGNERDNIVLSIQRAYKVKYYLVYEKRIPMSSITSDGYSSVEPVGANDTDQGRAMNRRVELQLIKGPANSSGISPTRGDR